MSMAKVDIRDAFFDEIYNIAAGDKDVIFITADADAFSLRRYKKDFPGQFLNVGVAEQNLISVAAGLALSGKKVFVYAIIPFITLRCYEQIKVNICSLNLPVTIIGVGSGLSFGNDGPTHHAMQDIAVMRILPELVILNPADAASAQACAKTAYRASSPVYVRIDKGMFPEFYSRNEDLTQGFKVLREVAETTIVSTGYMTKVAMEIADQMPDVGVIDLFRLKPVEASELFKQLAKAERLISLEENSIVGGLGTILSELLTDNLVNIPLKRIALPDVQSFVYGTREWLHRYYKIDRESVAGVLRK
ncbi:MAG: transketolase C-terminal domain-containing protein [Candidatus Margulisiibacteriota bacterium]